MKTKQICELIVHHEYQKLTDLVYSSWIHLIFSDQLKYSVTLTEGQEHLGFMLLRIKIFQSERKQNKTQAKRSQTESFGCERRRRCGQAAGRADSSAVGGLDKPQSVRQSVELLTQSESTG